jgi:superfamily II DNA or RNA helicase
LSKIIDNEREKMYDVLNRELAEVKDIAIASAYFNIKGYGLIKDAIQGKPLKFLVGRPQDESISFEEQIVRELEENEDNPEYYDLMTDAVAYFSDEQRSVRKNDGPFFHGKAYIGVNPTITNPKHGVGIVGSSNFTYAGLKTNNELNVINTDRELIKEISVWFTEKWNKATEYKSQFISFFENYTVTHTPYEVVAKALFEYYKDYLDQSDKTKIMGLKKFQIVSVLEAMRILREYNGVVIADSTGLGKTRTMIALATEARKDGKKVLLIAPKSVIETTWEKEMEVLDTHIKSVNSEYVSANPEDFLSKYSGKGYNFIIVDEAHYFKSASSNRYKALRDLILNNKSQVVLATATPVNNSLMDMYNLIALFADDNSIQDITGTTLKGYFTSNQKKLIEGRKFEMSQVLERFVVRHSRKFAKSVEPGLNFPERVVDTDPANRYRSSIDYDHLDSRLRMLHFATYDLSVDRLSHLRLPTGELISKYREPQKREKLKILIKTVVVLNIFKRLESSIAAFQETLKSTIGYMEKARDYASSNGYFLPKSAADDPLFDFDEEIPADIFSTEKYRDLKEKCVLRDDEKARFVKACDEDIDIMNEILSNMPPNDTKMEELLLRLGKIIPNLKKPNGVVIFTQYTATAREIHKNLRVLETQIYLTTGSECIDNTGRKSNTSTIIDKFQHDGGIIVSTDVLSEGQNLQNAQYVINYDFPWNPVVLIQRVGRIDRMGSEHKKIYLINIMQENSKPDDKGSLEHFIKLMKKLYEKIEGIKAAVGIDAPVLGEDADPKDFGKIQELIANGNSDVFSNLENEYEQFTSDPKDQLIDIINKKGEEWIKSIPRGIGAFKKYDKDGIFSLFTDGKNFYWRLKFNDHKSSISDINQIISILMNRIELDKGGQKIQYKELVEKLKDLKNMVIDTLTKEKQKKYLSNIVPNLSKHGKAVFQKLAEYDEELALKFKQVSIKERLVNSLFDSIDSEDFLEKARKRINSAYVSDKNGEQEPLTLKRICWCLLSPRIEDNGLDYTH